MKERDADGGNTLMLSRVADALFWMGRYLERADHLARAVGVTSGLELDLHGVLAEPVEFEWTALLAEYQQGPPRHHEGHPAVVGVQRWLLADKTNPGSVLASVNHARNNARSIRGTISPSMWRELNKLHWRLSEEFFQERISESPHDFCEETQMGVMLFHGICGATMMQDEGWHFIQMGRYLERADKVLRTLEAKLALFVAGEAVDLPVSLLQWAAVLKRCAAHDAYQRLVIGRLEPERIVEFLLANPDFPHSVRFCLTRVWQSLGVVSGETSLRGGSEPGRTVGRLVSDLTYLDREVLKAGDFQDFLRHALQRCSHIGGLLQQQYSLR